MSARGGTRVPDRARAAAVTTLAAVLLAGCTLPELTTPSPRPSPSPSPTAVVTPSPPPPSPTATPLPTPDRGAVPDFAPGDVVASLIDGLRVRTRPGVDAQIATGLLPLGAELGVVMGPFVVDDFGWYLVTDADPADPDFEEGWIAAGYDPDPFLRGTGRRLEDAPGLIGMSGTGDAEEGPVTIGEEDHLVRWIAADPERIGCRFAVSLVPAGGDAVATIRATVGSGIDRGTLQPQTFAALGVRGPAFVQVVSDCEWALVLERAPEPEPDPSPSASS